MLEYEKLDVYRIALEFVVTTVEIRDRLPRGNGELQVQFKRASFSIVLNIAEGAGKLSGLLFLRARCEVPALYLRLRATYVEDCQPNILQLASR